MEEDRVKNGRPNRIVRTSESRSYLKSKKQFRYITYGTSEYYTKPYEEGPHSPEFTHISLNRMIDLVEDSEKVLEPCEKRHQWLDSMKTEKGKATLGNPIASKLLEIQKGVSCD